jgi:SAM-dependent methyltransferase
VLSKVRGVVRAIYSIHSKVNSLDARLAAIESGETSRLGRLAEIRTIAPGRPAFPFAKVSGGDEILSGVTRFSYKDFIGVFGDSPRLPSELSLGSKLCQQEDFSSSEYRYWCSAIKEEPIFHRKQWEFFFICQTLFEGGALERGRRGLCFGAGIEPLPALFASMGCDIVATDQAVEAARQGGWVDSNEYTVSLAALNGRGICEDQEFAARVSLRTVDMNEIPEDLADCFDFCWSACCFEHLGSLAHGMRFVEESIRTLKIGGVAVHTTEFNLSSNDATYESRDLSIYRRRDIQALVDRLTRAGHLVAPVNWSRGSGCLDKIVDFPPFAREPHLRLDLFDHECTSIGLIIRRGH